MHGYECHITIEPVEGAHLETVGIHARQYGFRVADLLMQKRPEDTPERSKFDTFMTGNGESYTDLHDRMCRLSSILELNNFKVWRCKIEEILFDTKRGDVL